MKNAFAKNALSGICMLAAVGAAHAADVPDVPVSKWTGVYVGAGGGYQWGAFDVDTTSCDNDGTGWICNKDQDEIFSTDLDDGGFLATGQLGFDYQFHDMFVLGAMVDGTFGEQLSDSDFNKVNYNDSLPEAEKGQQWEASVDSMFTLSGRAGFLVTPDALVYGLAGWSWATAEATMFEGCDLYGNGGTCADMRDSNEETLNGWTLGGGVEWMFIDKWSARLEYRYTDLGSIELDDANADSRRKYETSTETDFGVQSVRLTLNYRF